jgi:uncharacterized protein VirK/YbjX
MSTTQSLAVESSPHETAFLENLTRIAGAILHPLETWKWRQLLKAHPLLRELLPLCPGLTTRIYRPFLSRRLDCAQRAEALATHYDLILASGYGELVKQAAAYPLPLCAFVSKSGVFYRLELAMGDTGSTGEMVLRLTSMGYCIYSVAFTFTMHQGHRSITIGELTGMLATSRDMSIRRVTKDFFGCRPKDLMVSLARELGAFFHCEKTVLISNRNKLRRCTRRICKKSSDYDRTWKELQATWRSDGNFELPCMRIELESFPFRSARTPAKRTVLIHSIHSALRRRLAAERANGSTPFDHHEMQATRA